MQLLRDLRRKYGDTLAEVIAFHAGSGGPAGRARGLRAARRRARSSERARGRGRRTCGRGRGGRHPPRGCRLSWPTEVQRHLRELAMPHVEVVGDGGRRRPGRRRRLPARCQPRRTRCCRWRASPAVASWRGRCWRCGWCSPRRPTRLVFDEVDAGIGGAAAVAVGSSLAALGERHQVLVVTHLAQVAALADTQVVVRKDVVSGATASHVATAAPVVGEERVDEVARMLSGDAARRVCPSTCGRPARPAGETASRVTRHGTRLGGRFRASQRHCGGHGVHARLAGHRASVVSSPRRRCWAAACSATSTKRPT